jgi:hypothetical protein
MIGIGLSEHREQLFLGFDEQQAGSQWVADDERIDRVIEAAVVCANLHNRDHISGLEEKVKFLV